MAEDEKRESRYGRQAQRARDEIDAAIDEILSWDWPAIAKRIEDNKITSGKLSAQNTVDPPQANPTV